MFPVASPHGVSKVISGMVLFSGKCSVVLLYLQCLIWNASIFSKVSPAFLKLKEAIEVKVMK